VRAEEGTEMNREEMVKNRGWINCTGYKGRKGRMIAEKGREMDEKITCQFYVGRYIDALEAWIGGILGGFRLDVCARMYAMRDCL